MAIFGNSYPVLLRDKSNSYLYFVDGKRRRRILFPECVLDIRKQFSGIKTKEVDTKKLQKFEPGAVIPRRWDEESWIEPPENKQMMREIIGSRLFGNGIEFGAGSRPMPLPIDVDVEYAEPFQSEEQNKRMSYTDNAVVPTLKNPIEDQFEVADNSLNFMVAAHVIEHTPNPIGGIVQTYQKLKTGGTMVLVVPDKRRTFDKDRENTTFEHLMLDYESPSRERDLENYIDFFENVKKQKGTAIENAKDAHRRGLDVHYHVWTPGSFFRMMENLQKELAPFRSFEVKPPINAENCLEFYVVAKK